MRVVSNCDVAELAYKVKVCAESGSVEDFEEIISEYELSIIFYNDYHMGRTTVEYILCDLAEAYIQRFPAEFMKKDRANFFETSLKLLLVKYISNRDEFSYKIADAVFKSSANVELVPLILSFSICSGWYEFLLYCLERIEKPWSYLEDSVINDFLILVDEQRYELLDVLFSGISEDEFINVLGLVLVHQNDSFSKTVIEFFCELAERYSPAACCGNDRIQALLEGREWMLLGVCADHIHDYYFRSWEYMREKGIRLHNASGLIYFIHEYRENAADCIELLKRYIKPILADDVYIDIFMLRGESVSEFLQILEAIGDVKDRVYINLTDKLFPESSEYALERDFRSKLTRLIKEGFSLHTEENFAKSHAAKNLINTPQMLELVLRNKEFSEEQLTELVETCIKEKKFGALNVVRKILEERASSNLKKKPRKDDV